MVPILLGFEHFLLFDLPFIYRLLTIIFESSGSRVVRALVSGNSQVPGSNPSVSYERLKIMSRGLGFHTKVSLSSPASRAALNFPKSW